MRYLLRFVAAAVAASLVTIAGVGSAPAEPAAAASPSTTVTTTTTTTTTAPPPKTPTLVLQAPVRLVPRGVGPISVDGRQYPGEIELSRTDAALRSGGTIAPAAPAADDPTSVFEAPVAQSAAGEIRVVDHADFEEYVTGLDVAQGRWPQAALDAQAIAARTFAARAVAQNGPADVSGYDICAEAACQSYVGLGLGLGAGQNADWASAVRRTHGLVLESSGRPILARYHAVTSGTTATNTEIFGGQSFPWLQAVAVSGETNVANATWTQALSLADVSAILTAGGVDTGGGVDDVSLVAGDGGPDTVVVKTHNPATPQASLAAEQFTGIVNRQAPVLYPERYPGGLPRTLPSPRLQMQVNGDELDVQGRGLGHGVGMSQAAAQGLAANGASARTILGTFYAGTGPVPGRLQAKIRVGLADGAGSVRVSSADGFDILEGDGSVLFDGALLEWRVQSGDSPATLAFFGPAGATARLALSGLAIPLRATPEKGVPVEFVLSKPAQVDVRVDGPGANGVAYRSDGPLQAGTHRLAVPAKRSGTYHVQIEASDGVAVRRTPVITVDVRTPRTGPSPAGMAGLVVVCGALLGLSLYGRRRYRRPAVPGNSAEDDIVSG